MKKTVRVHHPQQALLLHWAAAACGATVALLSAAPAWTMWPALTVASVFLAARAFDRLTGTSRPGEPGDALFTSVAAVCVGFVVGAIGTAEGVPEKVGWATLSIQAVLVARALPVPRT